MKLEVGKRYVTRDGLGVVKITKRGLSLQSGHDYGFAGESDGDHRHPWLSGVNSWTAEGRFWNSRRDPRDLIEEVAE